VKVLGPFGDVGASPTASLNPWRIREANSWEDVPYTSSSLFLFGVPANAYLFFFLIILAGKFPGQIIPHQYIMSTKVVIFKLMV
jgi:hypothetical protein